MSDVALVQEITSYLTLGVLVIGIGGYGVRYMYKKYKENVGKQLEDKEAEDRLEFFNDCIEDMKMFKNTTNSAIDGMRGLIKDLQGSVTIVKKITSDLEPCVKIMNEHSIQIAKLEVKVFGNGGTD